MRMLPIANRCPRCGQRPLRAGKVVRWVQHLTEPQLVELAGRLCRAMQETVDIEPERIRAALINFTEHQPKVAV